MAYLKVADLRWLLFTLITCFAFVLGLIFKEKASYLLQYVKVYLFILVFCIGTTTNLKSLLDCVMTRKVVISYIVILRLILVPAVALLYSSLFHLKSAFFTGMVYLSIVPSAMIASVFSRMFDGDVNINLLGTFFMMLMAPFTIPFLSFIYLHSNVKIDAIAMFINLTWNLLLPLSLGILTNNLIGNRYSKLFDCLMILSVAMIILSITSRSNDIILSRMVSGLMLALTFFYATVFVLSSRIFQRNLLADPRVLRAARNELSLNDCALSSVLALTHGPIASVPSAIAAIFQIVIIAFLNFVPNGINYFRKVVPNHG
jgi:bile acid:Na+ symporter, BASS family